MNTPRTSPGTFFTRTLRMVAMVMLLMPGAPAQAGDSLSEADRTAIRATVEAQLGALARDDAEQAFALASARVRAMSGTADAFMTMVRDNYAATIRPKAVFFQTLTRVGEMPAQRVLIMDAHGRPHMAVYAMTRDSDGQWRIDGCMLYEGDARTL